MVKPPVEASSGGIMSGGRVLSSNSSKLERDGLRKSTICSHEKIRPDFHHLDPFFILSLWAAPCNFGLLVAPRVSLCLLDATWTDGLWSPTHSTKTRIINFGWFQNAKILRSWPTDWEFPKATMFLVSRTAWMHCCYQLETAMIQFHWHLSWRHLFEHSRSMFTKMQARQNCSNSRFRTKYLLSRCSRTYVPERAFFRHRAPDPQSLQEFLVKPRNPERWWDLGGKSHFGKKKTFQSSHSHWAPWRQA